MPPVGFEPTISAGERPQTYDLDRTTTGTGDIYMRVCVCVCGVCVCVWTQEPVCTQWLREKFASCWYSNPDYPTAIPFSLGPIYVYRAQKLMSSRN